jgi:uncharacterized protein YkwD
MARYLIFLVAGAAFLLVGLFAVSAFAAVRGYSIETAVLDELNYARTQPQAYARVLRDEAYRSRAASAYDDPAALREALAFLQRQPALPALSGDDALAEAAGEHASLQARSGGVGHAGPRGESLGQRLNRHGAFASLMGENIAYGYLDPREVVAQLIVDAGVPDRGHRANIFNPSYREVGVACGPHPVYRVMCVTDFAGTLMRR